MKTFASVVLGAGVIFVVAALLGLVIPLLQQLGINFIFRITSFWAPAIVGFVLIIGGMASFCADDQRRVPEPQPLKLLHRDQDKTAMTCWLRRGA